MVTDLPKISLSENRYFTSQVSHFIIGQCIIKHGPNILINYHPQSPLILLIQQQITDNYMLLFLVHAYLTLFLVFGI